MEGVKGEGDEDKQGEEQGSLGGALKEGDSHEERGETWKRFEVAGK